MEASYCPELEDGAAGLARLMHDIGEVLRGRFGVHRGIPRRLGEPVSFLVLRLAPAKPEGKTNA